MPEWPVSVRLGKVPIDDAKVACLRSKGIPLTDWRFGDNPATLRAHFPRIIAGSQQEADNQALERVRTVAHECGADIQPEIIPRD